MMPAVNSGQGVYFYSRQNARIAIGIDGKIQDYIIRVRDNPPRGGLLL